MGQFVPQPGKDKEMNLLTAATYIGTFFLGGAVTFTLTAAWACLCAGHEDEYDWGVGEELEE